MPIDLRQLERDAEWLKTRPINPLTVDVVPSPNDTLTLYDELTELRLWLFDRETAIMHKDRFREVQENRRRIETVDRARRAVLDAALR